MIEHYISDVSIISSAPLRIATILRATIVFFPFAICSFPCFWLMIMMAKLTPNSICAASFTVSEHALTTLATFMQHGPY